MTKQLPANHVVTADELTGTISPLPLGIVARHRRTTNSTGFTTTETGIVRIDNIPIYAGRIYRIWHSGIIFNSTVAGDLIEVRFRYDLTGAVATTSSNFQAAAVTDAKNASGAQKVHVGQTDIPVSTNGTLSVLLTGTRTGGTGTCSITASVLYPIDLVVEDMGLDPGDTGIDI